MLGFDIGTSNLLVAVKGKGIVLNEPNLLAKKNARAIFFGKEAEKIKDKEKLIRPVKNGSIYDVWAYKEVIKKLTSKLHSKIQFVKPEILVNVFSGITQLEKRVICNIIKRNGGARKVRLIENGLAASIGAGIDVNSPSGVMVIDIGGGTCDIAVVSRGYIVLSISLPLGGDTFNRAIMNYIRCNFHILIDDDTAEDIKIKIGACLPCEKKEETIYGYDIKQEEFVKVKITSEDIRKSIFPYLVSMADGIKYVLSELDPEIMSDVIENGIVMCGGSAKLSQLCNFIYQATGIPAYVAEESNLCVINGIQKIIEGKVRHIGWELVN